MVEIRNRSQLRDISSALSLAAAPIGSRFGNFVRTLSLINCSGVLPLSEDVPNIIDHCPNLNAIQLISGDYDFPIWDSLLRALHRPIGSKLVIHSLYLAFNRLQGGEIFQKLGPTLFTLLGSNLKYLEIWDLSMPDPRGFLGALELNNRFSSSSGLSTLILDGCTTITREFLMELPSVCPRLQTLEIGPAVRFVGGTSIGDPVDYAEFIRLLNSETLTSLVLGPVHHDIFTGKFTRALELLATYPNLKKLKIASAAFPRSLFKQPAVKQLKELYIAFPFEGPDDEGDPAVISFKCSKPLQVVGQVVLELEALGYGDSLEGAKYGVDEKVLYLRICMLACQRAGVTPTLEGAFV